jgi:hypothetical protein
MILQPSNNALPSGSTNLGPQAPSFQKNINVSSIELASSSFNPSVNVELSSSKQVVSAIPAIYSKPTVYSSNQNQLFPSQLSSSSEAIAENAILSKPSGSTPTEIEGKNSNEEPKEPKEPKEGKEGKEGSVKQNSEPASNSFELSEDELKMIEELKARDLEVRAHEQAHKSVGGQYTGAISFSYQAGPDGKRYAVGGEVPIDVSPIAGNPQATIAKMMVVSAAARAPAQPSAQDQMVAAQAARSISEAQAELAQEKYEDVRGENDTSKEKPDSNSSSSFNSVYTNDSIGQFQSVAANDNEKVNLVDAIV